MNTGKVLLGFLVGISTGAILGILFAPSKGSSTRKRIARRADGYLSDLGENFDGFIDDVSKKFDNAKDDAKRLVDNAQEEAKRLADNGKAAADAADKKIASNVK